MADQPVISPETVGNPPPVGGRRRHDRTKLIFIAPAVIWILLFTVFPLLYALRTSFYVFRSGKELRYVGLDNFRRLWEDETLHENLQRTLVYVGIVVFVEMVLGFLLALLFNRQIRGLSSLRTVMVLPLFASPIALGYLGKTIFYEIDGPINRALVGLGGNGIPWLSDPNWAFVAIMIVDIWQWTPFVYLVLFAGLQTVPRESVEAAQVDGATGWDRFRHIELPYLRPLLLLVLFFRIADVLRVFDHVFVLTGGGPGSTTQFLSLYIYRIAFKFSDASQAAALAVMVMIVMTIGYSIITRLLPLERD